MHMVGHHGRSVENITLPVAVQAMPKNRVAGARRERLAVQLSKRHEDGPARLLVMRQAPAVVVAVGQRRRTGHG